MNKKQGLSFFQRFLKLSLLFVSLVFAFGLLNNWSNFLLEWFFVSLLLLVSSFFYLKAHIKKAENEKELHRLASFPEDNPNPVIEINQEGEITYANPASEKRFACDCCDCSHPMLKGLSDRLQQIGELWQDFEDEVKIDGVIFERRVKYMPQNKLVRIYGFEITHLKEMERALQEVKKEAEEGARLKSLFLANMSHEIRTPLNAIIGYTDLLMMDAHDSLDRERLSIISKSGKSLLSIINDILDFSKIEAGKLDIVNEEFSIRHNMDFLKQVFAPQVADKKIAFHVSCDENVPAKVGGDSTRLNQILVNLLSNAFKFTEKGSVSLHGAYERGEAVFVVSDTGIGISSQQQGVVFAEFQQGDAATTRKYGGTGLGLSITMRLVALLGGSLGLQSDVGKGAVFTVRLPLQRLEGEESAQDVDGNFRVSADVLLGAMGEAAEDFKVLLAEDDPINQQLIRELLHSVNLGVTVVANGQEALERLSEVDFDLLLLDIQMPVLNGMETIKRIREKEKWQDLYVIALTGEAFPGDAEKFLNAGCNDYLAKPVELEIFYGSLYALFADRTALDVRQVGGDEKQNVSFEAFPIVMTPELCVCVIQMLDILKKNLKIFNPEEIDTLAGSLEDFSEIEQVHVLQQELRRIAATFDDEALPDIISKLEANIV